MSLVKVQFNGGNFNPDENFWELNQQLRFYSPYSKLYNRDKSKNKKTSSLEMWCITFMCHPDQDVNIFYRMNPDE